MNDIFTSNKYKEIKLNKLINGFEINNKVDEYNKNEENVDVNDLVKLSGGNQ